MQAGFEDKHIPFQQKQALNSPCVNAKAIIEIQ